MTRGKRRVVILSVEIKNYLFLHFLQENRVFLKNITELIQGWFIGDEVVFLSANFYDRLKTFTAILHEVIYTTSYFTLAYHRTPPIQLLPL